MKVKLIKSYKENEKKFNQIPKEERGNNFAVSSIDIEEDKVYEVVDTNNKLGWYRIVDESSEDYLYPPDMFEIVEQ